jgi:hypothetical protein
MHRLLDSLFWPLLLAAITIACTGDGEQPTGDPTAGSPVSTATPPSPASPSPRTLEGLGDVTLVFLRGDVSPEYPQAGAIWTSGLNGANANQVTPTDVAASFVGVHESNSGAHLLYYMTQDADGKTTIFSTDLDTGETVLVLSYMDIPNYYFADVSPDARYIAHTQPLGLDMYEVATGNNTTLFQSGSGAECSANVLEQCYRAIAPEWSPDGRLLRVVHSVYEGGWVEVVDPFQSPVVVFTAGDRSYPHNGRWSTESDALCAQGIGLAELSGLYLLESPNWEARNLFPEFEDYTINPDSRQVIACDWLNGSEVAFLTMKENPREGELHIFNRKTAQSGLVTTLPEGTGCCGGTVSAVPETSYVLAQVLQIEDGPHFPLTRPALVDTRTGEKHDILQTDDIVLAVFAR